MVEIPLLNDYAAAGTHGRNLQHDEERDQPVNYEFTYMINPNGEDFTKDNPLPGSTSPGSMQPGEEQISSVSKPRFQEATEKMSTVASDTWQQTKEKAGIARQRTEFFLRENPVPTVSELLPLGSRSGWRFATRRNRKRAKRR